MEEQIILACTKDGKFSGRYVPKIKAHQGRGTTHLAIAVLLFNSKGEVLLQKRKHQIFDNLWDLTGATHPLHLKNGVDETFKEAALRCLKREYGITQKVNLQNLGAFNYFARDNKQKRIRGRETDDTHFSKYKNGLCENEYCYLLIGEYNGKLSLNSEIGYQYKWVDKGEFLKDISQNPQNYTPWAKEAIKILQKTGFLR
ncbi:NUDIX domain-containing protein [Patescibacteria group bacterium]|nr:NUDIX domain-containing protein [Patescibacteria group bacterium]